MSTTTIRVTSETHEILRTLAGQENLPIQSLVHKAVSQYRRRQMLEAGNLAYAALRAEPAALAKELEESAAWDVTLADGLDAE